MKVKNIHERTVHTNRELAAEVFESLGTKKDKLWPGKRWPPMRLNASKAAHGGGGHGPIRYRVTDHQPGRKTTFEFEESGLSRGLKGIHYFELDQGADDQFTARHVIEAELHGPALFFWPALIRPLHDALVEDALDNFEMATTRQLAKTNRYSVYVRMLRAVIARR